MYISSPFTYHLYHTPTGKHYYGVRYKKGCYPEELWKSYFSSSPLVHQLIEEFGKDSFIPTVRKLFKTAKEAVFWENKFLIKVDAQNNANWLNRHNGGSSFMGPHSFSDKTRFEMGKANRGKKFSEETKAKMRVKALEREAKRKAEGWTSSIESRIRSRSTLKDRIASGEIDPYGSKMRAKMSSLKKGTKRKYLPDGSFIYIRPN